MTITEATENLPTIDHPTAIDGSAGPVLRGTVRARAYVGDGAVLLAFDLHPDDTKDLAGFAIRCTPPKGAAFWLENRLAFDSDYSDQTTAERRTWTDSNLAPFQKFWWSDYPRTRTGKYGYEITAMKWSAPPPAGQGPGKAAPSLVAGPTTSLTVDVGARAKGDLDVAFTHGYIASQAYATKFQNAPIVPDPKTHDFDITPFEAQYAWLGAGARELVYAFLDDVIRDPSRSLDVFAYDIDEPEIVRKLAALGPRLRIVFDDCEEHQKPNDLEPKVWATVQASAGAGNVAYGHFRRFAHHKVLIERRAGVPTRVLTGSANWSIRGLYVQANNVLRFEDEETATVYALAFESAFAALPKGRPATPGQPNWAAESSAGSRAFSRHPIAWGWHDHPGSTRLPRFSVAFSPHARPEISLQRVAERIRRAKSSVLFAIMQLRGGGPAMDALDEVVARPDIFTYGVSESVGGLELYKPDSPNALAVPFTVLSRNVPAPFRKEWAGGGGIHIHHKFVVIDFNGDDPVVYTGSSNLAGGGETENGDNLLEIRDRQVAEAFAVEAIRLVDHYHFRAALQKATLERPLALRTDGSWAAPYYDPSSVKKRSRELFAGTLP